MGGNDVQTQGAVDAAGALVSAVSGIVGWLLDGLPVALVGVKLSVIVMAFSGVMLMLSVLPAPTEARRNWLLPLLLTVGASSMVNLALKHEALDASYSLGMGFVLGSMLTVVIVFIGRNWARLSSAVIERWRK